MELSVKICVHENGSYGSQTQVVLSEVKRLIDSQRLAADINAAVEDAQIEVDRQLTVRRKAERAAQAELDAVA